MTDIPALVDNALAPELRPTTPTITGFAASAPTAAPQPALQPLSPRLPENLTRYANTQQSLADSGSMSGFSPTVQRAIQQMNVQRLARGSQPLTERENLLALLAAQSQAPVTTPPADPSPWSPGQWLPNVRDDLGQLLTSIPRIPFALAEEARQLPDIPDIINERRQQGMNLIEAAAGAPGIRMLPGAYIAEQLAGGRPSELAAHPLFTVLDALPAAQSIAKLTDAGQLASKIAETPRALGEGRQIGPVRAALTRTVTSDGTLTPNRLGYAAAGIADRARTTRGGLILDEMFGQRARDASRVINGGNQRLLDEASPAGTASTDSLINLQREVATLQTRYPDIDEPTRATLMRHMELDTLPSNLPPAQLAYANELRELSHNRIAQQTAELGKGWFIDGEFYDTGTGARILDLQRRAADTRSAVVDSVLPRLETTVGKLPDPSANTRLTAVVDSIKAGDLETAYRELTLIGQRTFDAGRVNLPGMKLLGYEAARRRLARAIVDERKAARFVQNTPPARFIPALQEQVAQQVRDAFVNGTTLGDGTVIRPVDPAVVDAAISANMYRNIPGYDQRVVRNIQSRVQREWLDQRAGGLDPTFFPHVNPDRAAMDIAAPKVFMHHVTPSHTKKRTMDFAPFERDPNIALTHQTLELLAEQNTRRVDATLQRLWGKTRRDLELEYYADAERAYARNPRRSIADHLDRIIRRDFQVYDPENAVRPVGGAAPTTIAQQSNEILVPRVVASTIKRSMPRDATRASALMDATTGVFRTALVPLSPRAHIYNIIGGGIMTAARTSPMALFRWGEARQLLANPELRATLPRELANTLGTSAHEVLAMDAASGTTLRRLADEVQDARARGLLDKFAKAGAAGKKLTDRAFSLNSWFDDSYRVMSYLYGRDKAARKLARGGAVDASEIAQRSGVELARKVMQQWEEITPLERSIARQIFPFYTFCVDDQTEALTDKGWVKGKELTLDHRILSMDPATTQLHWSPVRDISYDWYVGEMPHLKGQGFDAFVTPGHKFATSDGQLLPLEQLRQRFSLQLMGEAVDGPEIYSDAFVELVGWAVCEGHYKKNRSGNPTTLEISQSWMANPDKCDRIRQVLKSAGARWHEFDAGVSHGIRYFGITGQVCRDIMAIAPNRVMTMPFLLSLSPHQRQLLIDTMIAADGTVHPTNGLIFVQKSKEATDAFVALCSLSGIRTTTVLRGDPNNCYQVQLRKGRKTAMVRYMNRDGEYGSPQPGSFPTEHYDGYVWCPTTDYGTFVCRRNGHVYVTGNSQHIIRYVYNYPPDHPIRAAILGSITRAELEDQSSGLPWSFMNLFTFGGQDDNGNVSAISTQGLNPFNDVANYMTLGGWIGSSNPIISTVLQQVGLEQGKLELYPDLRYDANTGQLVAASGNPLLNFVNNTVPQSRLITSMLGMNREFREMLRDNPEAAMRQLRSQVGIPILYRELNLPQEFATEELQRDRARRDALNDAMRTGNVGEAERYPQNRAILAALRQAQATGQLSAYTLRRGTMQDDSTRRLLANVFTQIITPAQRGYVNVTPGPGTVQQPPNFPT